MSDRLFAGTTVRQKNLSTSSTAAIAEPARATLFALNEEADNRPADSGVLPTVESLAAEGPVLAEFLPAVVVSQTRSGLAGVKARASRISRRSGQVVTGVIGGSARMAGPQRLAVRAQALAELSGTVTQIAIETTHMSARAFRVGPHRAVASAKRDRD